jgi:galactokinase
MPFGDPVEAAVVARMASHANILRISTPGRVCLFGEHQDYLLLPVIPSAISLRIAIEGVLRDDRNVNIALPDIGSRQSFSLSGPLAYGLERDYFRSSVNVLLRHGYTFSRGCDCTVHGTIPINSGTSSSSALIITWINFLTRISDQHSVPSAIEVARLGHEAEVLEFGEPGGMMDHYSTSCGGIIAIDFLPTPCVEVINTDLGGFVLGDSGEPKDTKNILSRVKEHVLHTSRRLAERHPGFSLLEATEETIDHLAKDLAQAERELLRGTIRNRDLTREARRVLAQKPIDHQQLGRLLSEHQVVLREILRISTPKIDTMLQFALEAGAYGGKINGSGGGGCMFVYAPEDPERVARAIARAGGKPYIVHVAEGTREETPEPEV